MFKSRTPPIRDKKGAILENSMTTLEAVQIGGVKQWVLIRGENKDCPLLLFIHGGPGSAQIGFIRKYEQELEKHFIVVNWDQRGAGKSGKNINPSTMNLARFVEDAHELITYLLSRFGRKKLFLAGHSWGSILGTLTSQQYPDSIHAYIGISQLVHIDLNEQKSYAYALKRAREVNHQKAVSALSKIGKPPYPNFKVMMKQRKWLLKFIPEELSPDYLLRAIPSSTEYTLKDWYFFFKNVMKSNKMLWDEFLEVNLFDKVPEVDVPVYLCEGCYDYQAPFELAQQYLEQLHAPRKEIFWFKHSGHSPHISESKKFSDVCSYIKRVSL
ncbi:alpha/beta fold hydrolase [Virgibacillus oceani]|uniref:Alpha/beta hydrolase n=1 Tax=Virgibacillus oceani TaxID=1479511 RepID=A0A917M9T9_9BACI|nr:alpha/beta hydrolase [Virgibacillus oceani]GGG86711.1 alpha/beta hydrolase [Virgibacillus oceani]